MRRSHACKARTRSTALGPLHRLLNPAAPLSGLLALERRGHSPELIAARRELHTLAPELPTLYMARRRIGHG